MKFKERNIYKLILITVNALLLLLAPLFLINLLRVGVTKIIQSKQTWHFIWRPYFIDGRFLLNEWIYIQEHDECIDDNNCLFWYPITKSESGYINGLSIIHSYKYDSLYEHLCKQYNKEIDTSLLDPPTPLNTTKPNVEKEILRVKQELDNARLNPNLTKGDLNMLKEILSTKSPLTDLKEINNIDGLDEKEFLKRFKHNLKDKNNKSNKFFRGTGNGV